MTKKRKIFWKINIYVKYMEKGLKIEKTEAKKIDLLWACHKQHCVLWQIRLVGEKNLPSNFEHRRRLGFLSHHAQEACPLRSLASHLSKSLPFSCPHCYSHRLHSHPCSKHTTQNSISGLWRKTYTFMAWDFEFLTYCWQEFMMMYLVFFFFFLHIDVSTQVFPLFSTFTLFFSKCTSVN